MKTHLLFLLISISAFSQKKMVLIEGFQDSEPEIEFLKALYDIN